MFKDKLNVVTMYQEFVANAEVDEEEMAELLAAKYVVNSGDYKVTIERGRLESSEKGNKSTPNNPKVYGSEKSTSSATYYKLADLDNNGYILLLKNQQAYVAYLCADNE